MFINQGALVLFSFLVFHSTAAVKNAIKVGPCEGKPPQLAKLNSVDVTPCPSQPCIFHKGTTVNATIYFTPNEDVSAGRLEAFGKVGEAKLPFPLPQPDACEDHGLKCPLKEGVEVGLKLSLPIKHEYPSLEVTAIFDLKDQANKYLFCFEFAAKIAD